MGNINEHQTRTDRLIEIGIALSSELNLEILLNKILRYARELTSADAGTLYLLKDKSLHFTIMQNDSLGLKTGGEGAPIELAPVPVVKSNVSGYAAITGKTIKIDDLYESNSFDFTGPRRYDAMTGYHCQSMLVVPMKDHEARIIGVVQLINAIDPDTKRVIPFPQDTLDIAEALASQAAVAITNARLIKETKDLFEGLIKVLAMALDSKSPSTHNHIHRVALFNVTLAQAIHDEKEGPFASVQFTKKQLEAIRVAGWLHDVGKIVTPIWMMEKIHKLEMPFDRIEHIRTRFNLISTLAKARIHEQALSDGKADGKKEGVLQNKKGENIDNLKEDLEFLEQCNSSTQPPSGKVLERLDKIAHKTYFFENRALPYLTEDEQHHLSVRNGNLTEEELEVMRNHIVWTKRILAPIPFPDYLKNVSLYAAQHHEKLNGTGYPDGAQGKEIPLPSRILAVADQYEALTSGDRSYKKSLSHEETMKLMQESAMRGEIDRDIVELMIKNNIQEKFEQVLRNSPPV